MRHISAAEYLLIFSICVFILQYLSKIAIENYENTGQTEDPTYSALILGILGTIFAGSYSLYQIHQIGEETVRKSSRNKT